MVKSSIFVLALLLLLTACEKDNRDLGLKYDYLVYSYFLINSNICLENPLYIKKVYNPEISLSQQNIFVDNASVAIYDVANSVYNELVYADSSRYISLNSKFYFKPQSEYRIEIYIGDYYITGSTTTPALSEITAPELSETSGYFPEFYYNTLSEAPLFISCQPDEQRIVYIESYCLEPFENAKFIHSFGGIKYPEKEEDFEDFLTGFPRRTTWLGIYSANPENDGFISFSTLNILCYFYGEYKFSVYIVDENYYNYSYKKNGWEEGGIINAYGVLGSGYCKDFYFRIVE